MVIVFIRLESARDLKIQVLTSVNPKQLPLVLA
jgi:hypothetical protein